MGITNVNKQINVSQIDCQGTVKVTLALTAAPDISTDPTDMVLVLDRSGSMAGAPLENMKQGAKTFIDIIDGSTDSAKDGNIGSGSRIGIVSFSSSATADTQLITSVADLQEAVESLTAGGSTNHAAAFSKAMQLFDPLSANTKVIVMFTDGKTTAGPPPSPVAEAARAAGIVIYCIGLMGSDGIDSDTLDDWATDPADSHVAITPDETGLEDLFASLAANISKPGATNIILDEVVNPDFSIISVSPPTLGTATTVNFNTLQWKISKLGVSGNEGATLEFFIRHTSPSTGIKEINQSITYSDDQGNQVDFPSPVIQVDCGEVVTPEPCPVPVEFSIEGCQDTLSLDLGDTYLESQGRILELSVTLKKVCPGKRVALGVILTETDPKGTEHPRGLKTITVPAHSYPSCRDIRVECIKFVLPEDLNVSGGSPHGLCGTRHLKVRLLANTIDTDHRCCDTLTNA